MRINAYVLVADPSFLKASLSAYYDRVEKIILSYDRSGLSWTGTPLPIQQCLDIVAELDTDGKCVEAPGSYARLDHDPLDNDTFQRQEALDIASDHASWVLQLDTDEVMLNQERFFAVLDHADAAGAVGLDYPSRLLYSRSAPGRYLEKCDRRWRLSASYPGPLAVKAGTDLRLARQIDGQRYRADFRSTNTDPWGSRALRIDETVHRDDAIMHFSWVRDVEVMRRKLGWSGHAPELADPAIFDIWMWRTRHPLLATLSTPFRRKDWLRTVVVPEPPGGAPPIVA
ncbi:hypothetical protein [Microbacterium rhizosphaerae]|uniref:Glycosyltransferase family 2 protein n=1 Tax=Microbacterium rhizosphaerae TaxID=1678237 RepID=A0ABZ0SMB3_9MICO|nr:hypothetical protein [Microbacterium rhizosphaerae]WPR89758.1 hypothetical protein SM116_00270 [Microbacterium rhizosphaerae]